MARAFDLQELIRLRKAELAAPDDAAVEKALWVYIAEQAKWAHSRAADMAPLVRSLADFLIMQLDGNMVERIEALEAQVKKLKPKRKKRSDAGKKRKNVGSNRSGD